MKKKLRFKYDLTWQTGVKVIVMLFGVALIVMLLWNWLMPMIFGLITLTYWQSMGVYALFGSLFKGSLCSLDSFTLEEEEEEEEEEEDK